MPYAVEMRGIVKQYPGLLANDHIDLRVEQGEVHALVGENGAGKTTLMKVLYGLEQPEAGTILIDGSEVRIPDVAQAIRLGIGMVHQHFMLLNHLTVAENVVLGAEPVTGLGLVDTRRAHGLVSSLAEKYGFHVDPAQMVSDCPVGTRQNVEILKVLYRKARILILDEPTAVLTPQETRGLFTAIKALAASGVTIIFITHKLEEVMAVADGITVLRHGKVAGTLRRSQTTAQEVARLMVGRDIGALRPAGAKALGPAVLEVQDLAVWGEGGKVPVAGVSFAVRSGEIVAVAGVAGNGQSEMMEAIAGLRPVHAGRVLVQGHDVTNRGVRATRAAGLGHIPEDRYRRGLAIRATVLENVIMGHHRQRPVCNGEVINPRQARQFAGEIIQRYDVRCQDPDQPAQSLSGGNLQKIIVGRELLGGPKAMLVGQPTRGLDIGASEAVRQRLQDLAAGGAGILLVSADLREVSSLADRILVMYKGRIAGELPPDASDEAIGLLMAGITGAGDRAPGGGVQPASSEQGKGGAA